MEESTAIVEERVVVEGGEQDGGREDLGVV